MKNTDILAVVGYVSFIYCIIYLIFSIIYFVLNTKEGIKKLNRWNDKLTKVRWISKQSILVTGAFMLFKICLTINLILFNPIPLLLIVYAYLTNIVLLCIFVRNTSKLSAHYRMAINPYKQFKLFHILLEKEDNYFDFSLQYWCLLMAVSTFLPIGIVPLLLVIQFWPFLIYLEFYFKYRNEYSRNKQNSLTTILLQLITLNLLQPIFLSLAIKDGMKAANKQ
ncbi:hypothetical protein [Solibacillus sp. NPDC093137]|uniref:hypothetical protein n=1 Tax=Solibacillus sp. NPDC093137 TaxID=3390678 RepID=UPI003D04E17C